MFTADMAVQNFVGDSFRGATWVSLQLCQALRRWVGPEAILMLDGSADSENRLQSMLHWDVNNGVARRGSWSS